MAKKSVTVEVGEARKVADYLLHLEGQPLQQAHMIRDLLDKGWTQAGIAEQVGWSQAKISIRLKLLNLIAPLQKRAQKGALKPWVAWHLANLPEEAQRKYAKRETIRLKDVEAERRHQAITEGVMKVLETPIPVEQKIEVCPTCGRPL